VVLHESPDTLNAVEAPSDHAVTFGEKAAVELVMVSDSRGPGALPIMGEAAAMAGNRKVASNMTGLLGGFEYAGCVLRLE
jgi:hypothetical protein